MSFHFGCLWNRNLPEIYRCFCINFIIFLHNYMEIISAKLLDIRDMANRDWDILYSCFSFVEIQMKCIPKTHNDCCGRQLNLIYPTRIVRMNSLEKFKTENNAIRLHYKFFTKASISNQLKMSSIHCINVGHSSLASTTIGVFFMLISLSQLYVQGKTRKYANE